jgi:hypothetical protein
MRPTQIVYPEDKLIRAYYNRDPTAKFVPADLSSAHTHHVRAFARRQLKVMQTRRLPEDEALKIVEAEAAAEERRAKEAEAKGVAFARRLTSAHVLPTNYLEQIQEEEELAWQATKAAKALEIANRKKRAQDAAREHKRLAEKNEAEKNDGELPGDK